MASGPRSIRSVTEMLGAGCTAVDVQRPMLLIALLPKPSRSLNRGSAKMRRGSPDEARVGLAKNMLTSSMGLAARVGNITQKSVSPLVACACVWCLFFHHSQRQI